MKRTRLLITAATTGLILSAIGIPTAVNALSAPQAATSAPAPSGVTAEGCKYPANKTPTLTLSPTAMTIKKGANAPMSGTLKGNDCPMKGKKVGMYSRGSDKDEWASAGTATTDDKGAYTFTAKPSTTTSYRSVFAGESGTWDPTISTTSTTVTVTK